MTHIYVIKKEYKLCWRNVCLYGAYADLETAKETAKNLANHCEPEFCFEVHKVLLDAASAGASDVLFSYDSEG